MKPIKLIALFLLFPLAFFGQKQLTGLWIGTMNNDSSTTRKEQSFEIALTEYRGKVYGYSRSEFIINDTLYYILKRVKGTIDGDSCEVKDDEILSYNFRGKLDKGVKVITTFHMNKLDSTWSLDGSWKTAKTKKYYSLTGGISLKEENDISQSKIFPHLEELNLAKDVPFYQEQKKAAESIAKNQLNKSTEQIAVVNNKNKSQKTISKDLAPNTANQNKNESVTETKEPVEEKTTLSARKKEDSIVANKSDIKKTDLPSSSKVTDINKPVIANNGPAAEVAERKLVFSPPVSFKSDTLELSLYDNGEIDGDTVSVLLNNEIIVAKECLKATAIKKTIVVSQDKGDSLILVLYAENLGKYPPNTGLLVIHDGDDTYQVRFTADLQTNAAIVLKRKKHP